MANVGQGELFGESFSYAEVKEMPVSVIATENTKVLLIDYLKVITACSTACNFHITLIKNMMKILAKKMYC